MTIKSQGRIPGATHRIFWERKASEYPSPFEKKIVGWREKIIGIVEKKGLPVNGACLLDIGCGTGTFALPFALRGASVTALDFSGNMLKRVAAEAERLGIKNVRTVRGSWKKIDLCAAGLAGAFDVVVTALSTAVETEEDILKMERCSNRWCVYVASGKIRRGRACRDVLLSLGAPLDPRPDVRDMRKKLENMGRKFFDESFVGTVKYKKSLEQIVKELAGRLEAAGIRPDGEKIRDAFLRSCAGRTAQGQAIEYRRHFNTGVLIWRVDEK